MELETSRMVLTFCEKTGAVRRLLDKRTGAVLADNDLDEPFLLELEQNHFTAAFQSFRYRREPGCLHMTWDVGEGVEVRARVEARADRFAFQAQVGNSGPRPLCGLEYPLVDGLGPLPGPCQVAHAFATGFEVDDPFINFPEEQDGFRHMPYPESFSGASMQFFTYCGAGAGLYFAAEDGGFHTKWLNFYKRGGKLRASHAYGYEDIGPGKPLAMGWDFLMGWAEDWYAGAEIYRAWALGQVWCRRGPLKDLPEGQKATWLLEGVGAATFGVSPAYDRAKWIERYARDVGAPLFHITGPDWPKEPQTYGRGVPGGLDDWFPVRFHPSFTAAVRATGGYFAPFEFDFLISDKKADGERVRENLQQWPERPKSVDGYTFTMLCPLCGYTQALHRDRDVRVGQETGCDAMYYDISANNILPNCMCEAHGHPQGAGSAMALAYRDIYGDTKAALAADRGKYIPLGTEMMNEIFLDVLDFYQARANAQPCSSLETWPFRKLIRQGAARTIPMLQYVYAGYAPPRLDGWGKLTRECGDIVYHTIAKTYLWGGLFEMNSEYSPMEVIDDAGENPTGEHYCDLCKRGFRYDSGLAAYLGKFARLRVGAWGRFWAYGQMLRPPALMCRKLYRPYYQYNHSEHVPEQHDRGLMLLDAVIAQAWRLEGKEAVFIANTSGFEEQCAVRLPFAVGAAWGEDGAKRVFDPGAFTLGPYEVMVVEAG
jgi:hypothetical protein